MTNLEETAKQLAKLVRSKTGDAGASVAAVQALPGHAAFGCRFLLQRGQDGAVPSGTLVLRLAPAGVRIAGPADVVRQARRMASLADTDVPVPPILWYGDAPEFFGRPYFVTGFVDSFKLADRADLSSGEVTRLAGLGVRVLAALHRVEWRPRRAAWGEPQSLETELERLDHLLDRPTLEPSEVAHAPQLRARLRKTVPASPTGCVHGDFQWGNILYNEDRVAALIDWEMALLGPTLLDLGWLCFFADPGPGVDLGGMRQTNPLSAAEIVSIYGDAVQRPVPKQALNWFHAFSCYRLGVLTCFNVMLHRRGKRHDPEWETTVRSAPAMFEHGLELLG
jgi:aminoglycoside phosphotransferase (APT) family kinase protein